jgi:hypothetical protein
MGVFVAVAEPPSLGYGKGSQSPRLCQSPLIERILAATRYPGFV